ncbi:MAG: hypothetical protein LBC67_00810 [Spirochaetales bacterium]|nr:hypothetical protein [Spirochaetales bacterium]
MGVSSKSGSNTTPQKYTYGFINAETGLTLAVRVEGGDLLIPFRIGFPLSKTLLHSGEPGGFAVSVDRIESWSIGFGCRARL